MTAGPSNAELLDQLTRMKAAYESIFRSLSNGVLTLDDAGNVAFVNAAAAAILHCAEPTLLGRSLAAALDAMNAWVLEAVNDVRATGAERRLPNSELFIPATSEWVSVNLSVLPLMDGAGRMVGAMLVLENLQREQNLRRTMSRYVASDVIDRVLTADGALLSGSIQPVSILFSDIRGFSKLSEMLGAQGTVSLLNGYFSYMEDVVANRSGIIDKYIGDSVMAVFGSPLPGPQDAENAVQAAADMLQVLAMFNAGRALEPPVRIGIGIASGPVLVGNIGSPKRMDFTVIGDSVNLASRLESATKIYGADILLDAPTRAGTAPGRIVRLLDTVRVIGQDQPTELWEVLDHRAHQWAERLADALGLYADALARYRAGDWKQAGLLFTQAAALNGADKAARLLAERCAGFIRQPPETWDGAFRLQSK